MSKVKENNIPRKQNQVAHYLDTLAHLDTNPHNKQNNKELAQKVSFQKRAESKAISNGIIFSLIDNQPNTPLIKSYWNTYYCNHVILQEGNKVSSTFCNNRWCLVCNRIRTAKLINGYSPALNEFDQPMFVTLTDVTVKGRYLRSKVDERLNTLSNIIRALKKAKKAPIKAIRKLEVTYNETRNEYQPHIHMIVEGEEVANLILCRWLKQNKTAKRKGQDIQPADENSLLEIFKYTTKIVTKDGIHPIAQDLIFRAIRNKRTIQAYGIKRVSENIERTETTQILFKPPQIEIFKFDKYDWVSAYGELFSEYSPTNETIELINKFHKKF